MPSVGRKDHSKDYTFENIEMQEHAENAKEQFTRIEPWKTKKPVFRLDKTGNPLCRFDSTQAAARHYGIKQSTVWCAAQFKEPRLKAKWQFKFASEINFKL